MSNLIKIPPGTIEYSLQGKGPVVLVLHGGHTNCHTPYPGADFTMAGFTKLAVSRPGYGRTDISAGTTPELFADSLNVLLAELEIEKVSLLAISAGGPTALWFASKYPAKTEKLILQCALSKSKWLEPAMVKQARRMFSPGIERFTWFFLRLFFVLAPGIAMKTMMKDLSTLEAGPLVKSMDKTFKNQVIRFLSVCRSERGFAFDIEQEVPDYTGISCPVLLEYSSNDGSVGWEHALYARKKLPHARLVDVKTACHFIWFGPGSKLVEDELIHFLKK